MIQISFIAQFEDLADMLEATLPMQELADMCQDLEGTVTEELQNQALILTINEDQSSQTYNPRIGHVYIADAVTELLFSLKAIAPEACWSVYIHDFTDMPPII